MLTFLSVLFSAPCDTEDAAKEGQRERFWSGLVTFLVFDFNTIIAVLD